MKIEEIREKLETIAKAPDKENFIYDFLSAFGLSKTTIARLKKGDYNLSKNEGELFYKNKIFFREDVSGNLLEHIDEASKDEKILRNRPRFILFTDYNTFVAVDVKLKANKRFSMDELPEQVHFFLPLSGAEIYKVSTNNEADRNAAYRLGELYDILVNDNPDWLAAGSHHLNLFLSRLLFCFFAEDTGIFPTESIFTETLANHTKEDGSDVDEFLNLLFGKLNDQSGEYPAYLNGFPYVNGGLFRDEIICPKFSKKARKILIDSGELNWSEINPDIFGSMIQAVADPEQRSSLGMHYTSVENILKLILPLFLDELYEEFETSANSAPKLRKLINRMANIKFFDPACGSGNFLIITYKELRQLEVKILRQIISLEQTGLFGGEGFKTQIKLSRFYGIEIKDFAHEMAILSLWLAEHQMNLYFDEELDGYGKSEPILPLKQAGNIIAGNAARINWEEVCPKNTDDEIYIIGNPPYLGARVQDVNQKRDIELVFHNEKGVNNLDYISIWFYKGAKYIENQNAQLAFVSTNSVCQGEQVSLFWPKILNSNLEIPFAHHSFKWTNNAIGNAGVTVIIVGLRNKSTKPKYLYNNGIRREAKNINAYLLDSSNIYIYTRTKPISKFPEMNFGSMPNDKGNLILDETEMQNLTSLFSKSKSFIKGLMGGEEFIKGTKRYCLWIDEDDIEDAKAIQPIAERIENVKTLRENSNREATKKLAKFPFRFGEVRHKNSDSIIVPATSSEKREYIPIGFLSSDTVISNSAMAIYDAQPWLFGIIHSKMHMIWVDAVGGKLETRYRYSAKLCYNTFPFPEIDGKQKLTLNAYVFAVLDERAKFPEKTMAWLYNPDTMPAGLRQAHKDLDRAIEEIYRMGNPFNSDAERLEFLFKLYEEMTKRDTLFAKEKKTRKKG